MYPCLKRRYDALIKVLDDLSQLGHKVLAALGAVVLDHHTAILRIIDLEFARVRLIVRSLPCQRGQVRSRGGRGGVAGELADLDFGDVSIALAVRYSPGWGFRMAHRTNLARTSTSQVAYACATAKPGCARRRRKASNTTAQ